MAKKVTTDPVETAQALIKEIRMQQARLRETMAQAQELCEQLERLGANRPPAAASKKPN